ncbi:MAG: hypothetical protein AMXMBFR13_21650 [Phycisphaerae bacterium]
MALVSSKVWPHPLAVEWEARLRRLRALLGGDTTGPVVFQWAVQARILKYLLARYGLNPSLGPRPLRAPGFHELAFCRLSRTWGQPPRTGAAFRGHLLRIAEENRMARNEMT